MNSIVSAAAIASATAIPKQPAIANVSPIATDASASAKASLLSADVAAAIERYQTTNKRWDVLSGQIDKIQEAAQEKLGWRPIPLVAWRKYSHIGGGEIELARSEFLEAGIAPDVVEREYADAKKRYQAIIRAGRAWDRKAGLSEKRKLLEQNRFEYGAARKALGKIALRSIADAVAVLNILQKNAKQFGELTEPWETAAFLNATRFLTGTAGGISSKQQLPAARAAFVDHVDDPIFAAIEAHRKSYAEFLDEPGEDDALTNTDQLANALLTVEPTSIDGAAALLHYYAECMRQDDTYFPDGFYSRKDRDEVPFAAALTNHVSAAMLKIRAQAAFT